MKKPHDNKRSPHWPAFRKKFLFGKSCAVCGGKKKLEPHHILPFHLFPERELDEKNLIALCEGNKVMNCHLAIGHSFSFKSYNPNCAKDAEQMNSRIKGRP